MQNLSIMIKPNSGICNMKCDYCFYHTLCDSRKQQDNKQMTIATSQELIMQILDTAQGGTIYIVFQGGEPTLLGIEYYLHFCNFMNEHNKYGSKIHYSMQTNGIQINKEWCKLFKEHNFLVGISLDGDRIANKHRKLQNGCETFDMVMSAINLLNEYEIDYNILSVVTQSTIERIDDIYSFFKQNNFKYLQFIPCLDCKKAPNIDYTSQEYGEFLVKLFDKYKEDYLNNNYVSIRLFDNMISLIKSNRAEQCGVNGICGRQIAVESNGDIYPCDFYCDDNYLLGNITTKQLKDIIICEMAKEFINSSSVIDGECQKCGLIKYCRACGCKRYRREKEIYCGANRYFFEKRLIEIIKL